MCKRNRYRIKALQIPFVRTNQLSIQKYSLCTVYNDVTYFLFYGSRKTGDHLKLDTSVDRDVESAGKDNGAKIKIVKNDTLSKKNAREEEKYD